MGHAVGLQSDSGIEVLVHVGVDTVNMNGDGFEGFVKADDVVKAGQPMLKIDRAKIAAAGYKTASSWLCPTPPSSPTSSSPSRLTLLSPPAMSSSRSSASSLRQHKGVLGWSGYPAALFYYNAAERFIARWADR